MKSKSQGNKEHNRRRLHVGLGTASERERMEYFASAEMDRSLRDAWDKSGPNAGEDKVFRKDEVLDRIMDQVDGNGKGNRVVTFRTFVQRYAAVLAFGLLLTIAAVYFGFGGSFSLSGRQMVEVTGADQGTTEITLPDGTLVALNAGSTLMHPRKFTRAERNVSLMGEGYFEVAKDLRHPFVVVTPEVEITVLGTRFNVVTYSGEGIVETTLLEGKVKISRTNPASGKTQSVILTPDHKATFYRNGEHFIMDKIDATRSVAWRTGALSFDNETLASVTRKLERRYNVEFVFTDRTLGEERISLRVDDEPLSEVLQIIGKVLHLQSSRTGDTITLSRNVEPAGKPE